MKAQMAAADEVHAIGILGSRSGRCCLARPSGVTVTVDRPGRKVLLLLGSREPVTWHVRTSPDTRIAGIVVNGNGDSLARVRLEDMRLDFHPALAVDPDMPLPYRPVGVDYEDLQEHVWRVYGRLDSFHGIERPRAGFVIADCPAASSARHRPVGYAVYGRRSYSGTGPVEEPVFPRERFLLREFRAVPGYDECAIGNVARVPCILPRTILPGDGAVEVIDPAPSIWSSRSGHSRVIPMRAAVAPCGTSCGREYVISGW